MRWSRAEPGAENPGRGTEGGEIVRDEEHDFGARITLERLAGGEAFAITCGVYGWMMHTRFFDKRDDADQAMADMKRDLDAIIMTIPRNDDPDLDTKLESVSSALSGFVDKYPT